jgi:hypothetical protein
MGDSMTALSVEPDGGFWASHDGWIFAPHLGGLGVVLGSRFARYYLLSDAQKLRIGDLMAAHRRAQTRARWLVAGPAVTISFLAMLAKSQPDGTALIPTPLLIVAAIAIGTGLILMTGLAVRFRRALRAAMAGAPLVDARMSMREIMRYQAMTLPTYRIVLMLAGASASALWLASHVTGRIDGMEIARLVAVAALSLLALRAGLLLAAKRTD